ncbi:MAG: hypothetical protein AAGG79_06590, partial [Pseudomonadota bacterium]
FDRALEKAQSDNGAAPRTEATPPPPVQDPPSVTAPPPRPISQPASPTTVKGRHRRASDFAPGDLNRFAPSDADFSRFEERFGISADQRSTFDNAFSLVRTQVLQAIKDRGGQIIGVTSPSARNGKTVSSIHLARACARRAAQTVVLADLNLQRPLLAGYLDARDFRSGIGFFRGEGRTEDYLTRVDDTNLLLFLSDRGTQQSAELLASARLKQGLEAFRNVAPETVVICNLPPILGGDDVMTIMPQLDGVVLVAAACESSFKDVEEAAKLIPREKLLCAIMNKCRTVDLSALED